MPDRAHALVLAAILALAVLVRVVGVNYESLSMDEITEVRLRAAPVAEIVTTADGFPPLYQLLLKAWTAVGDPATSARWLSVILGALAVWAAYRFARETSGPTAALYAAGMLAISPLQIWFAQEARAYPLAFLFAALAFWRFARALRTNRHGDWLLYAATAVGGLYTHYYVALLVGLHALWVGWCVVRRRMPAAPALTAHAVIALAVLPLFVLLRGDLAFQSGTELWSFSFANTPYTLYAFLLGFSTGLSLRELHGAGLAAALTGFLPWLIALATCLVLIAPALVRSIREDPATAAYLALMTLAPLLLCDALGLVLHVKYKVQYALWASIPMTVLLARALATSRFRPAARAAMVLYVALAGIAIADRHLVDRYRNEDTRALASYLADHAQTDDPILVITGYMADPVRFYLGPGWSIRALPDAVGGGEPTTHALGGIERPFWLVYTRPFHGDPDGRLRTWLQSRRDLHLEARFAGIELYRSEHAS
jgi:hypothetical protein